MRAVRTIIIVVDEDRYVLELLGRRTASGCPRLTNSIFAEHHSSNAPCRFLYAAISGNTTCVPANTPMSLQLVSAAKENDMDAIWTTLGSVPWYAWVAIVVVVCAVGAAFCKGKCRRHST
ncbi:MAG: hypothetical protein ABIG44_16405 [Planctomycetota bacterium]